MAREGALNMTVAYKGEFVGDSSSILLEAVRFSLCESFLNRNKTLNLKKLSSA